MIEAGRFKTLRSTIFGIVLLCVLYAAGLYLLNLGLSFDHQVSSWFFDANCQSANPRACWLINKDDAHLTYILHDLPVHIIKFVAACLFALLFSSFFWKGAKKYRTATVIALLAIVGFPALVSLLKHYTGHYCPGQLAAYGGPVGGELPYRLKPRCYPAGFPSIGFGFIIFYFSNLPVVWRYLGLCAGLGLGCIFSIIQLSRGEHFLSHSLATLLTAVFIGGMVYLFNEYRTVRKNAPARN